VAFYSAASNLVGGDTNGYQDIFRKDTVADGDPPVITVEGVSEGEEYTDTVTAAVTVSDDGSGVKEQSITLDGDPYSSGTPITQSGKHTLEVRATDNAGNSTSVVVHFSIVRSIVRSTALSLSASPCDYSDSTTLSATLTCADEPVADREIAFKLDGVDVGGETTGTDGVAALDVPVDLPEGSCQAAASFAGDDSNHLLGSDASATVVVGKEKATLAYTGDFLKSTDSTIALAATMTEEPDGSPGDITRSGKVVFEIYDSTSTLIREVSAPVTEEAPGNGKAGATGVSLPSNVYQVKTRVEDNGYYQAEEKVTELAIYNRRGGFTVGAGLFWENGTLRSFAFGIKYLSCNPLVPKGFLCFTDWTSRRNPTRVEATQFFWLVIPADRRTAFAAGTCKYNGEEGYTFRLTVEDNGPWWPRDFFRLTVMDANNQTVYQTQGKVSCGCILVNH
jgi:hypothetical protein